MEHGDGPSFPSGDSLGAGVTAGVLAVFFSNKAFFLIALWASLGRQYWFFHYFFDTVFGGGIGIASAYFVDSYFGGLSNITNKHVAVVLPIFIILQKFAKMYGAWMRSGRKVQ